MPFSGGGGGQLSNHVHDNTPLQGGPLNFNNTTISGMNQGDITFSDGAALQTLTYPAVPANETLQAVALSTAPSWVAAAPASSVWQELADVTLGVSGQLSSGVFAAHDMLDIWVLGANTGANNTTITFNNSAAANYKNNNTIDDVYASNTGNTEIPIDGSNHTSVSYIHLNAFYDTTTTATGYTWQGINFQGGGWNPS